MTRSTRSIPTVVKVSGHVDETGRSIRFGNYDILAVLVPRSVPMQMSPYGNPLVSALYGLSERSLSLA